MRSVTTGRDVEWGRRRRAAETKTPDAMSGVDDE
jgi:hypothetical protein